MQFPLPSNNDLKLLDAREFLEEVIPEDAIDGFPVDLDKPRRTPVQFAQATNTRFVGVGLTVTAKISTLISQERSSPANRAGPEQPPGFAGSDGLTLVVDNLEEEVRPQRNKVRSF